MSLQMKKSIEDKKQVFGWTNVAEEKWKGYSIIVNATDCQSGEFTKDIVLESNMEGCM